MLNLILINTQVYPQTESLKLEEPFRTVYSLGTLQITSVSEARALVKILMEHLRKNVNSTRSFETVVCENNTQLEEALKQGYDLTIVPIDDFFRLRKQFKLVPHYTNQTDGGAGFNYLLAVNRNDTITQLKSLKGSDINVQQHSKSSLSIKLLDKLLKDSKLPESKKYFGNIIQKPTAQGAILSLVLGKVKAALFTEQSFKVVKELNPHLEKQLRIIYRSPRLLVGLTCTNEAKQYNASSKKLIDIFSKLHEDEYGKQLMNIFLTEKLVPVKEEDLQSYLKFFAEK